jgi:hypothetical protein
VCNKRVVVQVPCRGEAQKAHAIFQVTQQTRFGYGLRGFAADPANADERHLASFVRAVHFLGRQTQNRLKQADARFANRKLSGVHTDGEAAGG